MKIKTETICAIATGNGIGAIAIVRVSGPDSKKICSRCFSKGLSDIESHTLHFGTITAADGVQVDEVLSHDTNAVGTLARPTSCVHRIVRADHVP